MGIQDIISIPINVINSRLRGAQKQLHDIKSKSAEIREEHLRELLAISQTSNDDKQQENRLRILIRAHQKQFAYKRLQYVLKPTQRGGLSHIPLVPENLKPSDYPYDPEKVTNWSPIHDHDLVQQFIQQRNITHFSQAHGTPFTIPPLTELDWGAEGDAAEEFLKGQVPTSLISENKYVNTVLQHIAQRKQLPEIDTYLAPEDVSRGFCRWKESTSTSPSGCHLGLCRIPSLPSDDKADSNKRNA
jgi:hypothetical protein